MPVPDRNLAMARSLAGAITLFLFFYSTAIRGDTPSEQWEACPFDPTEPPGELRVGDLMIVFDTNQLATPLFWESEDGTEARALLSQFRPGAEVDVTDFFSGNIESRWRLNWDQTYGPDGLSLKHYPIVHLKENLYLDVFENVTFFSKGYFVGGASYQGNIIVISGPFDSIVEARAKTISGLVDFAAWRMNTSTDTLSTRASREALLRDLRQVFFRCRNLTRL